MKVAEIAYALNKNKHPVGHENLTIGYIIIMDITGWKHVQEALEDPLGSSDPMIDTFPNLRYY
jgi:hypothetical protein